MMKFNALFLIVFCAIISLPVAHSQANSELQPDQLFIINPSVPMSAANFGLNGFSVAQGFNFVSGADGVLQVGSDLATSTLGANGLTINQYVSDPTFESLYEINSLKFKFTKQGGPFAPNIDHWTIETLTKTDTRRGLAINNVHGDDGLFFDDIFYLGPSSSAPFVNRVGIGTTEPKAKLHLSTGDIYLETINSGVIMKSPNGNCWKLGVSDVGGPVFTSVTCPS